MKPPPFPPLFKCNVLTWLVLSKALWEPYEASGLGKYEARPGRFTRVGKHVVLHWDQACVAALTTNRKCRVRSGGVVYGRMPRCATRGCCLCTHWPPPLTTSCFKTTSALHSKYSLLIPLPRQILTFHLSFGLNFRTLFFKSFCGTGDGQQSFLSGEREFHPNTWTLQLKTEKHLCIIDVLICANAQVFVKWL